MANVNIGAEATVATRVDTAIAAGLGNHMPIGDYSGADYRSAVRFPVPAWSAWTAITKATLTFYISDFQHVGPKNSSIFCSRMNISTPVWSKAAGTQNCESGFSGGNTTQSDDLVSTATDRVSFNSGTTANRAVTIDVTAAMRYYWSNGNGTSKPVFVFDNNGAGQYTELWSDQKTGGFDLVLSIDYETSAPPNAPAQTAPAAGSVEVGTNPTFSWTHSDPQGDAQTNAEVRIWDAAGTTLLYTWNPLTGAAASLVAPVALTRGSSYQWDVRTSDASGYGAYSAKRAFSIKANPVVVIDPVRYMEFANGAPRLRVKWSVTGGVQYKYRVTGPSGYDSGLLTSTATSHLLDTLGFTSGSTAAITVYVETADPLNGSATASFTPRYGLTTHRRDLTAAPLGWGTPSTVSTIPPGADIHYEYGSAPGPTPAVPTAWFAAMSSVPLAQFLFWRAWFIPSATAGPVLDYINIPTDATAAFVDKWGTTRDTPGLALPWSVSKDEYVYGSRSVTAKLTAGGASYCYAYKTTVKQNRSYILTGLMQSVGNSGACIELQDGAGNVLKGGAGYDAPPGTDMRTGVLVGDRKWFTEDERDVNRYKTPVWEAPANMDVYVVLKVNGVAGAQAWFDAIKLEESTVATPWSPGAVGATVVDAGGVQVDASKGGVFRLRGSGGQTADEVTLGAHGLEQSGVPIGGAPSGAISMFAGAAAPAGWLLCQGQSLLRTDYPALFTAIGVVYGSVDGTHFTLPDLRQKFPMGVAAAGTGNALGASGGQVDHTHDYTQVVNHEHTETWANGVGTGTPNPVNAAGAGAAAGRWAATHQAATVVGGVATGVTAAKNPPFLALNFIIKT